LETDKFEIKGDKHGWKVMTPKTVILKDKGGKEFNLPAGWSVLKKEDGVVPNEPPGMLQKSESQSSNSPSNSDTDHSSPVSTTITPSNNGTIRNGKHDREKSKEKEESSKKRGFFGRTNSNSHNKSTSKKIKLILNNNK